MRQLAILLAMLCLGASVAACNTVRGIGQDIERGGEIIQRTAK
ncbi:entericidin A/B family lipoprotein [Thauera sinica]|uniref:Entericidin A/B family lipoprotein n=1 Tax=Thauera sinica TaxID=2665146 RepID=A0ABW1AUH0_9RHOO|nr:entericidin A/B family lipoprotein [Thauera sp. K11]ATE59290.1 entericidin EcnA/B family protein [Thauera sp. K11]